MDTTNFGISNYVTEMSGLLDSQEFNFLLNPTQADTASGSHMENDLRGIQSNAMGTIHGDNYESN